MREGGARRRSGLLRLNSAPCPNESARLLDDRPRPCGIRHAGAGGPRDLDTQWQVVGHDLQQLRERKRSMSGQAALADADAFRESKIGFARGQHAVRKLNVGEETRIEMAQV